MIGGIKEFYSGIPESIIDLGTADGTIKNSYPSARCVGVEYSLDLVEANSDGRITLLQGDVSHLSVHDDSFDIAVATAIIEHISEPERMLEEVKRVLKPNGLLILTAPDPFWEHIAIIAGHLPDEQHNKVMNLKELVMLFENGGFEVLERKKFMLSPVGMPLEI